MKVTVLLLVSALSLLVVPAVASPHHRPEDNLNSLINLAEKFNESLNKEFFVEDVSALVDAGCKDEFFCKVYDILHKRQEHNDRLVRTLKGYIDHKIVNCPELLKNVTSTGVTIQLPKLMDHLVTCIRQTNFKAQRRNS